MRRCCSVLFAGLTFCSALAYGASLVSSEKLRPSQHLTVLASALAAGATALYLFHPRRRWEESWCCRACGQNGQLERTALGRAHPSLVAMLFGGFFFMLLLQQARRQLFACGHCSAPNSRWTFGSGVTMAWCVAILLLVWSEMTAP